MKKNFNKSYRKDTEKFQNFVIEPIGDKPVTSLAGVGEVLGKRLAEVGFDKAYAVMGQYLLLKKDKALFIEWFKMATNSKTKNAEDCHRCLKAWCDQFMPQT